MNDKLTKSWQNILKEVRNGDEFKRVLEFVNAEIKKGVIIYPLRQHIFNAFKLTEFESVKVVILGQDPYYGEYAGTIQANGLAFSVNKNIRIPPSLVNIYKEIAMDLNIKIPIHGDLTGLAEQGVFLLNTVLTVKKGIPNSHQNRGWELFTDKVIQALSDKKKHLVFMLWGANAQRKVTLIDKRHTILKAPHPSPLSAYRGFFGCKHFSKANKTLEEHQQKPINWQIK